jgi:hypothetical protein
MQIIQKSSPRLAAAGALCVAAMLAPAGTAAASAPPELQALIAKMKTLQVSSERFSATLSLHAHKVPKDLSALRALKVDLNGEANLATPESAVITTTLLGKPLTVRVIGKTIYTDEPALARKDGGRPWVKETRKVQPDVTGSTPGAAGAGTAAPYAAQAALIEGAKAFRALGTATVDGQPVSRFLVTVDPTKVPGADIGKLRAKLRHDHITPKAQVEYDLSPEGLPVHTAGVIALGKIRVTFTADVLATDFPLTVAEPPPAETIATSELLALLKKQVHKKK